MYKRQGYPAGVIDLDKTPTQNVEAIAAAKGVKPHEIIACVLDRPRHNQLVDDIRAAGAKVRFIMDGDVAGAIAAARDVSSIDIAMGIGGTPEGVVTACALKCLGGEIQGMLAPQDDREREKVLAAGHDLDRVLGINDLVTSDNCYFAATGVTNGDMLRGVTYRKSGATTRSLVMRSKSGTVRFVESQHQLAKLQDYSVVDYSEPEN